MDSKRSCCSPLSVCGMAIETCCFVFAIINAVSCSMWLLGGLGLLNYSLTWLTGPASRGDAQTIIYLSVANFFAAAAALTFAVFLCIGVSKKKPCYIMVYLVYGMVTVTLSVLGSLSFIGIMWWLPDFKINMILASLFLGGCALYSAILLMVYQTYMVLSARTTTTGHQRFENTSD